MEHFIVGKKQVEYAGGVVVEGDGDMKVAYFKHDVEGDIDHHGEPFSALGHSDEDAVASLALAVLKVLRNERAVGAKATLEDKNS